jgi:formamidopyrimidine-DNA glycosylase
MVEGPKVYIKARKLRRPVEGKILTKIVVGQSSYGNTNGANSENNLQKCIDKTLLSIECVGKEMFFVLTGPSRKLSTVKLDGSSDDDGHIETVILRLHFGMNGSERFCSADQLKPPSEVSIGRQVLTASLSFANNNNCNSPAGVLYLYDTNISIRHISYYQNSISTKIRDVMAYQDFHYESALDLIENDPRPIADTLLDQYILPGRHFSTTSMHT